MSVNKVILVGNVGEAPEVNYLPSGVAVANFSLATSESWTKDGQKHEKTTWHYLKAFDRGNYKMAQYIAESVQKGTRLYIEGKMDREEWEKDGEKRNAIKILVENFEVLANGIPKDQQGQQQSPQPQTFGDPWADMVPAGEAKKAGATIEQIKQKCGGNIQQAISQGWVVDDIPF